MYVVFNLSKNNNEFDDAVGNTKLRAVNKKKDLGDRFCFFLQRAAMLALRALY